MNHGEIIGSIFIPPNNTMRARYKLYGVSESDIRSDIYVKAVDNDDTDASIHIRASKDSDIDSVIDIKYGGISEIYSTIQPVGNNSIDSEIYIPPHNKMIAIYEVQEPPKITEVMEPIQDSYTREKMEFQSINYGKNNTLAVGRDSEDYLRTYVQFSLDNWNLSYTIIGAEIRLYYSGVISEGAELELFNLNEPWLETGITHLNRPVPTSLIVDEYTQDKEERYIEFSVTEAVLDWINGSEVNNGFIVRPKNEALSSLITFRSRESSTPPELRILYYDNRIYSAGRSQVLSDIFVWRTGDSDINSDIEVSAVMGVSDIASAIYVHQFDVPVENDIYSEIVVNVPSIYGEITVYRSGESETQGVLAIRSPEMLSQIDSEIMVSKPSIDGEIYVKHRDGILSEITVEREDESDIGSIISISRDKVYSEIYVKHGNDIDSDIYIKAVESEDIDSELYISKPIIHSEIRVVISDESSIESEIYVKHNDDVNSEIIVQREDENNIDSEIYVKYRSNIDSDITIRAIGKDDIDTEIYVKYDDDILSEIAVSRDGILSDIYVKCQEDLDSDIYIKHRDDVDSGIYVKHRSDIASEIVVQIVDAVESEIYIKYRDDISSEIDIKVISDILSKIDIVAVSYIQSEIAITRPDVYGEIMVPYWDDSDIFSDIRARVLRVSNISTTIRVAKKNSGYVFII